MVRTHRGRFERRRGKGLAREQADRIRADLNRHSRDGRRFKPNVRLFGVVRERLRYRSPTPPSGTRPPKHASGWTLSIGRISCRARSVARSRQMQWERQDASLGRSAFKRRKKAMAARQIADARRRGRARLRRIAPRPIAARCRRACGDYRQSLRWKVELRPEHTSIDVATVRPDIV